MKKLSPIRRFSSHIRRVRSKLKKKPITAEDISWAKIHLKKALEYAHSLEHKSPSLGAWAFHEVALLEDQIAQVSVKA